MEIPLESKIMLRLCWILVPSLFVISLVYTSLGMAGGSSYVALLYLVGIPLATIPPIVLFFNIIAASTATYRFNKSGHCIPKLIFPLLLSSVPAAFFGARVRLDDKALACVFSPVLFGIALILFFVKRDLKPRFSLDKKATWALCFVLGAALGFLAGVMGIGGGIFLGPVSLLVGLASPKQVAAMCAAFCLCNSGVGLISHALQERLDFSALLLLGIVVFFGAQAGSFLGAKKLPSVVLQKVLAFILLAVSVKLIVGILK
jgi:hypothetical protein